MPSFDRVVSASVEVGQAEGDEAEAREILFERISAASVSTLGQIATVHTPDREDEPDTFPWADAATWSPADIASDNFEESRYPPDELDGLFGEQPDEEVGSVDELSWYGLVKHEDRPGGLILIQDEQGFRHVREAPDDETLAVQWAAIQQEYASFYEQRDAYERATTQVAAGPSGHSPRIWGAACPTTTTDSSTGCGWTPHWNRTSCTRRLREATQIFGGYGFMNEFPVGRFYRHGKILEISEGTSEVQRMLIARELGLR